LCANALFASERRGWWENARDGAPGTSSQLSLRQNHGTMPTKTHARLRLQKQGNHYLAWIDNGFYAPVEITLHSRNPDAGEARPALPLRISIPARTTVLATRIRLTDTHPGHMFDLQMDTTPGPVSARPQDYHYRLPFESAPIRIDQGFGGTFSHLDPQNHYAIDFSLPEGTTIVAARDGTVMQIESDSDLSGLSREPGGGRVNFIRILHNDGTMAIYAHLQETGILVQAGQHILAGQAIARSGNTGLSTAPHLHFSIQVNRGEHLESIPFRIFSDQSELKFPRIEPLPYHP
jgi:murein DD-endopeptidase MepM/ murein hydrolase activator NlpD